MECEKKLATICKIWADITCDNKNHIMEQLYLTPCIDQISSLKELEERLEKEETQINFIPKTKDHIALVCGNSEAKGLEKKGILEMIWDKFGGACANTKGYKVFAPKVIFSYLNGGEDMEMIFKEMTTHAYASSNIRFGISSDEAILAYATEMPTNNTEDSKATKEDLDSIQY